MHSPEIDHSAYQSKHTLTGTVTYMHNPEIDHNASQSNTHTYTESHVRTILKYLT